MKRFKIFACLLLALFVIASGILTSCGPAKGTAEWHADQAYELLVEGRFYEAIEECNKAIELDPTCVTAYNNRGAGYWNTGQYDLAIADCTKAIELDPNCDDAYANRAFAYKLQGRKAEAIADLEMILTLADDPQYIEQVRREIEELSK